MLRFLFFFQERFYKSLMQNNAATTYKISSLRHVTKDNPTTHSCLLYFPVQEGTSTLPCVPTLCPNTTRLLLLFPSKHLFTAMVRSKLLLSKGLDHGTWLQLLILLSYIFIFFLHQHFLYPCILCFVFPYVAWQRVVWCFLNLSLSI